MATQYLCEKCGKSSTPAGAEIPRFCSHCGGALAPVESPDEIFELAEPTDASKANPAPAPKVPPVQAPPPVPAEPPPIEVKIPPVVAPPAVPPPRPVENVPIPAKPLTEVSAAPAAERAAEKSGDALDFREELVRCPNCGKQNPAAAEICTNCGYARSLGRTLTTRVRDEKPAPVAPVEKVSERGIAAEKEFANRKKHAALNPLGDQFRLWVALLLCLGLAALVMAAPQFPYTPPELELHGQTLRLPALRWQDALAHLVAVFFIGTPLLKLLIHSFFVIGKTNNPEHLTSMRAAGSLAVVHLAVIGFFYFQLTRLHLEPTVAAAVFWGAVGVVTLLATWYLQNIRFLPALVISILSLAVCAGSLWFFLAVTPAILRWLGA